MKKKFFIIGFVILLTTLIVFIVKKNNNFDASSKLYSIETFKVDQGWGYNILQQDKLFIKQNYIPAVKGNHPFFTKNDAYKTAKLVIKRLDKNKLPTITIEDLKHLNVTLYN
ncbi:DUF4907 domain-containing protein [Aureibaculum sp. A20]|uniref:DUF4907 domain-containing protein n=1 Tax=Aureibaculum flavum TaxID=2795986 RepID=A0ABS0WL61_9FLAO|nr:DUF4907 domain-containing protein [Aureibaculum flavum]MBJ2172711.1 DUF4907 domain-containing protein [Aureibaculum flavum]